MNILHLTEQYKKVDEFAIVRKRPADRMPINETRVRTAEPPRGVNIFSMARVICKRAQNEEPSNKMAA